MPRKLHELIAVEPDLKGTAEKIVEETKVTFNKKVDHFMGSKRRYEKMYDTEVDLPDEDKQIVTTVDDKLRYTFGMVTKAMDAVTSKEVTNTSAKADVIVDGQVIIEKLPAVVLINLENQFKRLRDVLDHIPTLDPGRNWKWDAGLGYYVAEDAMKFRTKKVLKNHIKYEATDKHPAQVETYSEDIQIGRWIAKDFSGMKTPAEKSAMLERIDNIIRALKEARERANDITVQEMKVAEKFFSYIMGSKK